MHESHAIVLCRQFGPDGDVKLVRSNPDELTVEGSVDVSGSMQVKNIKIGGMDLKELIQKLVKEQLQK